jgi:hypothetical protein
MEGELLAAFKGFPGQTVRVRYGVRVDGAIAWEAPQHITMDGPFLYFFHEHNVPEPWIIDIARPGAWITIEPGFRIRHENWGRFNVPGVETRRIN